MAYTYQDSGAALTLYVVFFGLAAMALVTAWLRGRQWGDLSSRRHYGESLTAEEEKALRRSRRDFWIWVGVAVACMALSFLALR